MFCHFFSIRLWDFLINSLLEFFRVKVYFSVTYSIIFFSSVTWIFKYVSVDTWNSYKIEL